MKAKHQSTRFCILFFNFVACSTFSENEYGEFELEVLSYTWDQSTRLKNLVETDVKFEDFGNGTMTLTVHGNVKKNLGVLGTKLRCYTWNDVTRKYVPSFTLHMDNICKKQLAKEVLTLIPGLGKDCTIKPAIYDFKIMDFQKFIHVLTNGKFFYGKFLTLTDVLAGRKGRICRSNVTVLIKPLKTSTSE